MFTKEKTYSRWGRISIALIISLFSLSVFAPEFAPQARGATVAASGDHLLYVTADGVLHAVGKNNVGQLGDLTTTGRSTPVTVAVPGNAPVVAVAAGGNSSYFVTSLGDLFALGSAGAGATKPPQKLASGVVDVWTNGSATFYRTFDGKLYAFGTNSYGMFGDDGAKSSYAKDAPYFVGTDIVDVAIGPYNDVLYRTAGGVLKYAGSSAGNTYAADDKKYRSASKVLVEWATGLATPPAGGSAICTYSYSDYLYVGANGSINIVGSSIGKSYGGETAFAPVAGISGATSVAEALGCLFYTTSNGDLYRFITLSTSADAGTSSVYLTNVHSIATGGTAGTYFLQSNGDLLCYGVLNDYGELGEEDIGESVTTPRKIATGVRIPNSNPALDAIPVTLGGDGSVAGVADSAKTVTPGATLAFSVPEYYATTLGATFQWLKDGNAVAGATSRTFSPTQAAGTASYSLRITVAGITYTTAAVSVRAVPSTIHVSPTGNDANSGETAATALRTLDAALALPFPAGSTTRTIILDAGAHAIAAKPFVNTGQTAGGKGWTDENVGDSPLTTIPAGVTLQVVAGAIVKFDTDAGFDIAAGAVFTATGATFTHLADDAHGGDTNADGNATSPVKDRYSITGNGTISYGDGNTFLFKTLVSGPTIAAAGSNTYYITNDGELFGVGDNAYGQLGYESDDPTGYEWWLGLLQSSTPVFIAGEVASVATSGFHVLYITENGQLYGAGDNGVGQLGNSEVIANEVVAAAAGQNFSLFLTESGTLYGMGQVSLLGLSYEKRPIHKEYVTFLTEAEFNEEFAEYVADGWTYEEFLQEEKDYCSGHDEGTDNYFNWVEDTKTSTPVVIAHDIKAIAAASLNGYYVTRTGELYVWNNGTTPTKIDTAGLGKVTALAAGGSHLLFTTEDNTLYGIGLNNAGQLATEENIGNLFLTDTSKIPVKIAEDVVSCAAGDEHSLFVTSDGRLFACGSSGSGVSEITGAYEDGRLGLDFSEVATVEIDQYLIISWGTVYAVVEPALVAQDVVAVAAGDAFSLYVTADGDLYATGANVSGQFGNGTKDGSLRPEKVGENIRAASVAPSLDDIKTTVVVSDVAYVRLGETFEYLAPNFAFTLSVPATYENAYSPTYVWYKDDVVISGATGRSIQISLASGSASYKVKLTVDGTEYVSASRSFTVVPNVLFVATKGNDSNVGDVSSLPKRTISSAFSAHVPFGGLTVRVINDAEEGDVSVYKIEGKITVPEGVTLDFAPDTVVKFASDASFFVASGASLSGDGAVFTHLPDDTIGGDTNGDGDATVPLTDRYKIEGDGFFALTDCEIRYLSMLPGFSGTVKGDFLLKGNGRVYYVSSNVNVAEGTLTIEPGAILKFAAGKSIRISSKAKLNAVGELGNPIVFTSIKDDAFGGDTNSDGHGSAPQPGDWLNIEVLGNATFRYVEIYYASSDNNGGAIYVNGSGTVLFDNSLIASSQYDSVRNYGTSFTANNSVFTDCGIGAAPCSGKSTYNNCVFYDMNIAVRWGAGEFNNCIFSNISEMFMDSSFDGSAAFKNCLFWNPAGTGLQTLLGTGGLGTGNRFANPLFQDPDNLDFYLRAGSPAIDAAGAGAPATDFYGYPRVDDSHVANTGITDGAAAFADIGAFEYTGNAVSDIDLAAGAVTAPASATSGSEISVSFAITNAGTRAAHGNTTNELWFVNDNDVEIKAATLSETLDLAAGATKTVNAKIITPALPDGAWKLQARINTSRSVFEGSARANNTATATVATNVTMAALGAAGTSFVVAAASEQTVRIDAPASGADSVYYIVQATPGLSIYGGFGYIASDSDICDLQATYLGNNRYLLSVPAGVGSVYVTVENDTLSNAPVNIQPSTGGLNVFSAGTSVVPVYVLGYYSQSSTKIKQARDDDIWISIYGTGFTETTTVSFRTTAPLDSSFDLQYDPVGYYPWPEGTFSYWIKASNSSGAISFSPLEVRCVSPTELLVRVNIPQQTSTIIGNYGEYSMINYPIISLDANYSITVADGATSSTLGADNGIRFTSDVAEAVNKNLLVQIELPEAREGRISTGYITYKNVGGTDLVAPVLKLRSNTNTPFWAKAEDVNDAALTSMCVVAIGAASEAGVLRPGQEGRIPFFFRPADSVSYKFSVSSLQLSNTVRNIVSVNATRLNLRGRTVQDYQTIRWFNQTSVKPSVKTENTGSITYTNSSSARPVAALSGILRDADTNQPLSGVTVYAFTKDVTSTKRSSVSDVTDSNGRFILEPLQNSETVKLFSDQVKDFSTDELTVASDGSDTNNITLTARPLTLVEGYITPAAGLPVSPVGLTVVLTGGKSVSISNAKVEMVDGKETLTGGEAGFLSTTTDANGYFAFKYQGPGDYTLSVKPDGHYYTRPVTIAVPEDARKITASLELRAGVLITGTVKNKLSGVAVAGAQIAALDATNKEISSATTDGNGNYSLTGFNGGTYILAARAPSYVTSEPIPVTIADGEELGNNNFEILPDAGFYATIPAGNNSVTTTFAFAEGDTVIAGGTNFQWDFESDGTVDSTDKLPTKTFTLAAGAEKTVYNITLKFIDADGNAQTRKLEKAVEVFLPPPTVARAGTIIINSANSTLEFVSKTNPADIKISTAASLTLRLKSGAALSELTAGTIIVGGHDGGYCREVVSAVKSGDEFIIQTEEVGIIEAFDSGSIEGIQALLYDSAETPLPVVEREYDAVLDSEYVYNSQGDSPLAAAAAAAGTAGAPRPMAAFSLGAGLSVSLSPIASVKPQKPLFNFRKNDTFDYTLVYRLPFVLYYGYSGSYGIKITATAEYDKKFVDRKDVLGGLASIPVGVPGLSFNLAAPLSVGVKAGVSGEISVEGSVNKTYRRLVGFGGEINISTSPGASAYSISQDLGVTKTLTSAGDIAGSFYIAPYASIALNGGLQYGFRMLSAKIGLEAELKAELKGEAVAGFGYTGRVTTGGGQDAGFDTRLNVSAGLSVDWSINATAEAGLRAEPVSIVFAKVLPLFGGNILKAPIARWNFVAPVLTAKVIDPTKVPEHPKDEDHPPQKVMFNDRSDHSGDAGKMTAKWDFGDGDGATARILENNAITHVYSAPGSYLATLTLDIEDDSFINWTRPGKILITLRCEEEEDEDEEDEEEKEPPKSCDPNEMVGPAGTGDARYVKKGEWLDFKVYFENKADATAAAQEVFVNNQLSNFLDWDTFELQEISFNNQVTAALNGRNSGSTTVIKTGATRGVRIQAGISPEGLVTWYLRDWDTTTADNFPSDPYDGFLPPNDATHRGEGYVAYRIKLRNDAPHGARVDSSATIVFDYNEPITTDPAWFNTVLDRPDLAGIAGKTVKLSVPKELVVPTGTKLAKGTKAVYVWMDAAGNILNKLDKDGNPVSAKTLTVKTDAVYYVALRYTPVDANGNALSSIETESVKVGDVRFYSAPKIANGGAVAIVEFLKPDGSAGGVDNAGTAKAPAVVEGERLRLRATLEAGSGPLIYTWYRNSAKPENIVRRVDCTTALTDELVTDAFGKKADGYFVVVETLERNPSDKKGVKPLASAKSKTLKPKVIVKPAVTITTKRDVATGRVYVTAGKALKLAAKATGTAKINYEWRGPGGALIEDPRKPGQVLNKASISIAAPSAGSTVATGVYTVKVTNAAGAEYSSEDSITVSANPSAAALKVQDEDNAEASGANDGKGASDTLSNGSTTGAAATGTAPVPDTGNAIRLVGATVLLFADFATGETWSLDFARALHTGADGTAFALATLHAEKIDAAAVRLTYTLVGKDAQYVLDLPFASSGTYVLTVAPTGAAASTTVGEFYPLSP